MTQAIVLGAGMIGSTVAADLAADPRFSVTVADRSEEALARLAKATRVTTVKADLSDPALVTRLAREHDVVLGALASHLGFRILRAVIEARRPYVDISFMSEDALELSPLAERSGVCAVVDCGVAPGLSHMLCGYAASRMSPCESLAIYVGGLPAKRERPYEYKAPFAPSDVIEEYTRPARQVEGGKVVVHEALSGVETLEFSDVGTLEAFHTDGLRSLVRTLRVPNMTEKTLRYPGHAESMRALRAIGCFSKDEIDAGGRRVRPLDVTSALLFPLWKFEEGEADLTVMRVTATGRLDGNPTRMTWDLLDRYDPVTRTRSMSRTTGYPATAVARLLVEGRFSRPGVHPPETLGREPGILDGVLAALAERGVRFRARTEPA